MGGVLFLDWGLGGSAFGLDVLLGRSGRGRHRRIPVEEPAATVAGQQLPFAELVPGLGADTHAAAGALLIVDAGDAGAAGETEAVEADQRLGLDQRTKGLALGGECG